jgi:lysophospholipase L1-like esterase
VSIARQFSRYVAIGDSSTEGLDDPDPAGGYRGWANRLAERIAATQGPERPLLYANLGIRGRRTRQILEQQLAPALAMRPDLATLFTGTNDVVAKDFDLAAVQADVETMQRALIAGGATVLGFTLPDLTPVMPAARRLAPRIAVLNDALRAAAGATGALLVDFAAHAVGSDARLWSDDRLHANSAGHARIAEALAHALGLPGSDASWADPLPPEAPAGRGARLVAEVGWMARHLAPWVWQHLRGRSSGDGLMPKRPALAPVPHTHLCE